VGRDEVIYLICSHDRVALGQQQDEQGRHNVYRAVGGIGGPFAYDVDTPWARVRFPDGVRPSALGWAVLDALLESVEGLHPDASFDASRDPEGEDGRPWIFDRHLEVGREQEVDRGAVEGGEIEFRLEYIGKAGVEALRRATGPHHKMPLILGRMLMYAPHRLVYVLPCDIGAAVYEPEQGGPPSVQVPRLVEAVESTGIPRELLIGAAEEALIAALGTAENRRNTGTRQFPRSDAGDRLAAIGIDDVVIAFRSIPERVMIRGERASVDRGSRGIRFELPRV
jgi:hypothetical protein